MTGRPILNRKLTLEGRDETPDGCGGFTGTWTALGTIWGQIDTRTGNIRAGELSTLSRLPLRIVVRAYPVGSPARPEAGQRFVEGTRSYDILAVGEHDRWLHHLICYCEEEVVR